MKNNNTEDKALNKTDVSSSVLLAKFMGLHPIKDISPSTGKEYYYYNNSKTQDFEALPTYRSYEELMPVVEKIFTLQFDDENAEYYRLRTFGLRCEETNDYMVRFERHQLFKEKSLFEALYLAVLDCVQSYSQTDC